MMNSGVYMNYNIRFFPIQAGYQYDFAPSALR